MGYLPKNWPKAASQIRDLYSLPVSDSKDTLPLPNILSQPFFNQARMEQTAYQLGQQFLVERYLDSLNDPLIKADLWPLFGMEMTRFSPQMGGMIYFDGVTEVVDIGQNLKMAVMPFSDPKSGFKVASGRFGPLMYTKSAYTQQGALGVCLTKLHHKLPEGTVQGRITIEKSTLKWLNSEISRRHRLPLPSVLAEPKAFAQKISKSDIRIFDHNPEFYTVVNLGGHPLRFPRAQDTQHEGEVYALRLNDHELLLIDELRVLLGYKERAFIRGFHQSQTFSELQDNLGLSSSDFKITNRHRLTSSRLYDYSHPHLNILDLSLVAKKIIDPDKLIVSELGFESIKILRLTDRELWEQLLAGQITDSFTLASLFILWLSENKLRLTPQSESLGVVMEYRGYASGEEGWSIPYVPANSGLKIGEIIPDSGITRIIHPVRNISVTDLPDNCKYEVKALTEVLKSVTLGEYDISTISAIFLGLLHHQHLTYIGLI